MAVDAVVQSVVGVVPEVLDQRDTDAVPADVDHPAAFEAVPFPVLHKSAPRTHQNILSVHEKMETGNE